MNSRVPKLKKNIVPIVGWVEETLDNFLEEKKPNISFVHMDMDLYNPTKFALKKIKPYLNKGCIILFDELIENIGWEYGEYKALKEVFEDNEYEFKVFS